MARVVVEEYFKSSWTPKKIVTDAEVPDHEFDILLSLLNCLSEKYDEKLSANVHKDSIVIELETCDAGLSCENSIAFAEYVHKIVQRFATNYKFYSYSLRDDP